MITIEITLDDYQALALAQFAKRVGFDEFSNNASSNVQAYAMQDAMLKVRFALADQGVAPR
jgi:hypothetical protein